MIRCADVARSGFAMVAAAALVAAPPVAAVRGQQPTFKAATDAVYVTATVIDKDGRLVTDLTKDDFEVKDNGVVRDITVFRSDAVPFAIVIMLDISGSMIGQFGLMRQGVAELVRHFEPGDRANIGTFAGLPEVSPRFTSNPQTLLNWVSASIGGVGVPCARQWGQHNPAFVAFGGGTAVWDAIECGIDIVGTDSETPRRVVLVVTDGKDNASANNPIEVMKFAGRYGIMIYTVGMFGSEGVDAPTLRLVSNQSGGGYFQLSDSRELVATFARVAEELRHQYVFGFSPGSGSSGRHDLAVRALRPSVTVRARQVYIEPAPDLTGSAGNGLVTGVSKPAVAAISSADTPPAAVPASGRAAALEALDRYERGDFSDLESSLPTEPPWTLLNNIQHVAPEWIRARGSDAEPRRRLAIATFVLEQLSSWTNGLTAWGEGEPASVWLEWACGLLRRAPASPPERLWHVASIALLEASGAVARLLHHLEHAESRFPDEPRWLLAHAVAEEMLTWPERRDEERFSVPSDLRLRLERAYERASEVDSVRPEAQLRWGYFELRRGEVGTALTHFDQVGTPADASLRYLLNLFKGRALERANRPADAVAAYRLAFAEAPFAESATLALSSALVDDHRPAEATALITRMLAIQSGPIDPWLGYPAPEWRLFVPLITDLRRVIAQ